VLKCVYIACDILSCGIYAPAPVAITSVLKCVLYSIDLQVWTETDNFFKQRRYMWPTFSGNGYDAVGDV
jgi:hypothetical protein